MNYLTHDNGTFQVWEMEPRWDGSRWVSKAKDETPTPIDRRSAERILHRKAHPCECYDIRLKTSTIVYYIKTPKL